MNGGLKEQQLHHEQPFVLMEMIPRSNGGDTQTCPERHTHLLSRRLQMSAPTLHVRGVLECDAATHVTRSGANSVSLEWASMTGTGAHSLCTSARRT